MQRGDWTSSIMNNSYLTGNIEWKSAAICLLLIVQAFLLPSVIAAQEPCFDVHVLSDFIYCDNWLPDATLSVTIDGFTTNETTDSHGTSAFIIAFDVHAGHTVTITDGHSTKFHVVTNVTVNSVDTIEDKVAGTADPGTTVRVMNMAGGPPPILDAVADASGNWTADYGAIGFDLQPGHSGEAVQCDNVWPNYNCTCYGWQAVEGGGAVGEIISYSGDVYVNDVRAEDLGALSLEPSDRVSTLSGGYVEAEFGESRVNLGPNSAMRVAETATPTAGRLDEVYGRMRAVVESLSGYEMEIMTPQIISSMRGTEMLIDVTVGETRVIMLEHESDLSTPEGSQNIVLSELQGVVVTSAGIGEPFPVSPIDIERWWERMDVSVACPVDMLVTDPLGRRVGCSPEGVVLNEIPGATYTGPSSEPEKIGIPGPVLGDYGICLTAVGSGPYELSVAGMGLGDETFLDEHSGFVDEADDTVNYGAGYEPTEELLRITIDIKPGSFPNAVNLGNRGRIPVAVLTDDDFDATTLDWETVRFGPTGTEARPLHHSDEDVDGDGDVDMIFHFRVEDAGIQGGETSAYLRGLTLGGEESEGYDSIETIVQSFGAPESQQKTDKDIPASGSVSVQNVSNPLRGTATIEFSLPVAALARVDVVSVNGRIVKTLLNEFKVAGRHVVEWNITDGGGRKVPGGVYFLRASSVSGTATCKIVILN